MKADAILKEKIEQFERACRSNSIKITHQRREIFLLMAAAQSHPSAEVIYRHIKTRLPMISLDTVYRTLALFERIGIISRVQILDDRGRFDANPLPHHHLICSRCKGITDFYWPAIDSMQLPPETKRWGAIETKQLELRGICADCSIKISRRR